MINFNLHTFIPRLLVLEGAVIGKIFTFLVKRNTHRDPECPFRAASGFSMYSHYRSPTSLAEPVNRTACDREVSLYAAWFNSSGFEGWNLIQDSRHAKNSQMPERTKTLSPGSLRNLYTAALESKGFKVKISAKLETVKHLFYLKHIKALTQSKL